MPTDPTVPQTPALSDQDRTDLQAVRFALQQQILERREDSRAAQSGELNRLGDARNTLDAVLARHAPPPEPSAPPKPSPAPTPGPTPAPTPAPSPPGTPA